MLVHTSGPYSLDIKVTEKVLSATLSNNFYDLTSAGLILYKLEFPTGDFAIEHLLKSTLVSNIKIPASTTIVFDLCFISSTDFNKSNPLDIDLTDIVDTISYTNNSTNIKEDVVKFDLTKKLSSVDLSTNRYIYLAIRVDNSVQLEKFFVDEDHNDKLIIAETSFDGVNNLNKFTSLDLGNGSNCLINLVKGKSYFNFLLGSSLKSQRPISLLLCGYLKASNNLTIKDETKFTFNHLEDVIFVYSPTNKKSIFLLSNKENVESLGYSPSYLEESYNFYVSYDESHIIVESKNNGDLKFVDKANNEIEFTKISDNSYRLIKKKFNDSTFIEYIYSSSLLTKIVNNYNDQIIINYTSGKLSSVTSKTPSGKTLSYTSLTYDSNGVLSSIRYGINSSNIESTINISFSYPNLTFVNSKENLYTKLIFNDTKVIKCSSGNNSNFDKNQYQTYEYFNSKTKITNFDNTYSILYFDNFGRVINLIDDKENSSSKRYQNFSKEGELKVKEVSDVQSFSTNFLTNPLLYSNDFFADNCFWSLSSGSINSFKAINDISSKNKVLQINKSDSTNIDFYQTIRYLPGGNYKLYFDIKIDDASVNFTSSNFKAKVTVTYTKSKLSTGISNFAIIKPEIETITKTYEQTLSSVNFKGWRRIEKDLIEVPEESSTIYNIRVKVEFILSGNNYILYLNNIGFSKYPYAINLENFITNGYFNFDGNDWLNVSLAPVDGIKSLNYDDLHGKTYGFNCIKLTGNISSSKKIYKILNISGNEKDEFIFNFFAKANVTLNDEIYAYIKFINRDNSITICKCYLTPYIDEWISNTNKIVASKSFNQIEIGFINHSKKDAFFDCLQLIKGNFGVVYNYDNKNNLSSISTSSISNSNLFYNEQNKASEIVDENGNHLKYFYDESGTLHEIQTSKQRIYLNADNGQVIETRITDKEGNYIKSSANFDDHLQISTTDENDFEENFEYDSLYRLKKSTLNVTKNPQFNSTKNYEYNSNNTLKTLSIDNNSLNYSYLSSQYLSKVELSNNSSYSYSYTEDGFVETIKNNDFILRSDVYDETINGINTGLLSKSYLGSTSSSDYCTYIYDTNNNLIEIHLKSQNLTQINYFNDNSISQVSSLESGIEENYNYDTNGNVIYSNILNKNDKGYYFAQRSIYDNLNNLQGVIKETGDKKYIYDYSYSYESDETTVDDFLSFLDEILIGRKFDSTLYQSSLIADNTLKVKNQLGISVVNSGEYTDCLKFGDSSISYLDLINASENTEYEGNYSNVSRTISLWVKCNTISSSQILFTYGEEGNTSSHRFALTIGANKYLELTDRVENRSVTTTNLININKWNLINIYIFKAGSYFSMKLFLNGQEYSSSYNSSANLSDINNLYIGSSTSRSFEFKIAKINLSYSSISGSDMSKLYKEGIDFLEKGKKGQNISSTSYFSNSIYSTYNVISLNGTFTSTNGIDPLVFRRSNDFNKGIKKNSFVFDDFGSSQTKRYVYKSKGNYYSSNVLPILSYELDLTNTFTIGIRFKIRNFEENSRILSFSNSEGNEFCSLYIKNETLYCSYGSFNMSIRTIFKDYWHTLFFRYDGSKIEINVSPTYQFIVAALDFKGAILSIGGKLSAGSSVNTVDALFERLIFKNSVATDDEINSILNSSLGVSKTNYFDSFDRLKKTSINFGMSSLTHTYNYQNNNGRTSNSIIQEILPNNNVYSYSYDGFGNVNSVTFAESITQTGTTTHYLYDALNRLIKSYINPENPNIYSYDSNGNILSKNGVSYTYDPVYKDRLMSVGNDITFEYNSSSPLFPTKIIKGNNVFNLVWNTNRLESVNDISFVYDHFKRRIKKIRGYDVTKYFYSGEILEAVEISENNNTYKFIYHYDENRKLIGFSYNNNEYVYIRDILGNIRSIYGINEGTYLVNYSYDDRGQPTIASNNTEIGNLLAQKNCILYKGYLYDFETELFYCNSRYYSPELCRWISPDSIEYLDPESINGLNLYCYCANNPNMNIDPSGHAWYNPLTWDWGEIAKGVGLVITGVAAIAVGVVTLPYGGWIAAVAGVTILAGGGTALFGLSDIGEGITDYNVIRETVFTGNEDAYNLAENIFQYTAIAGSAICGIYGATHTRLSAARRTLRTGNAHSAVYNKQFNTLTYYGKNGQMKYSMHLFNRGHQWVHWHTELPHSQPINNFMRFVWEMAKRGF